MKTAIINIKTKPAIKIQAQKTAKELGFGLSALVNNFLIHLIKNKKISFSAPIKEEPTEYLLQCLKESDQDIKDGKVSTAFNNANQAIAYLHNTAKKYAD